MFRRNKHVAYDVNDSILGNTIFDRYCGESIDFDVDDSAKAENINAQ